MKKVLLATKNPAKIKRYKKLLEGTKIELITLDNLNINLDILENGQDSVENALIKARSYYNLTNIPTIAVDDSLYFINSDYSPKLNVRRINGKYLNDEEMLDYYCELINKYGINNKIDAKWVYGIALINDNKEFTYTWEKSDFYLTSNRSNIINQGYPLNTISVDKKSNKYFSEIKEEEKKTKYDKMEDVKEFILSNLIDDSINYLGRDVEVIVERPFGSKHSNHDLYYNVNYGYINDTISGDYEELDAYILDVDKAIDKYKGKVIGIIRRKKMNDDKLLVSNKDFTNEEIEEKINFQEKYFEHEIIRKGE